MTNYPSNSVEFTFWATRKDRDAAGKQLIELGGKLAISTKEKEYNQSKGIETPYIKAIVWGSEEIFSQIDELTKDLGNGQRITVKGRLSKIETWTDGEGKVRTSVVVSFLSDAKFYQWEEDSVSKEAKIAQEAAKASDDVPF